MPQTLTRESILPPPAVDAVALRRVADAFRLPDIAAAVLCGRGLTDEIALTRFFNPALSQLHSPYLFREMEAAVDRTLSAVRAGENICIYGDYDVDGITSIALLFGFLRRHTDHITYHIPNRITEGYGLSDSSIRKISDQKVSLILTVDCGITALSEIALARSLGMDVIVTDHHEPRPERPDALAVLNPKAPGETYPDKDLAGVGVAFKFFQALCEKLEPESDPLAQLDLVALGTSADIVPLLGENRVFVSAGLAGLKKSGSEGIKALLTATGLYDKPIGTGQILFQIAPLINAVGRLGDPRQAVELFLTRDPAEARRAADALKRNNEERKGLDQAVTEECIRQVERSVDLSATFFLVLCSDTWHPGVLGIAATRLTERFGRPSLVLSRENGLCRGSARSIPGFSVLSAITDSAALLENFGGHEQAAGVSIKTDRLDEFAARVNAFAVRSLTPDRLIRPLRTDADAGDLTGIDWPLLDALRRFEPFGPQNPKPVLYAEGLRLDGPPRTVGGSHLKFRVRQGNRSFDAIAFRMAERLSDITAPGRGITLAFTPEENEWNGNRSIQLNVRGIA